MDRKFVIPIIFLAFFIFLVPVDALINYASNPFFTDNRTGTIIFDGGFNITDNSTLSCHDVLWSSSYGGKSGVFYTEAKIDCYGNATVNYSDSLQIYPARDFYFLQETFDEQVFSEALGLFGSFNYWNKEIIVFLRYRLDNSSSSNIFPIGITHHLIVAGAGTTQQIELNLTEGVWHEYIAYVPASTIEEAVSAHIRFEYLNPVENGTIWIDTFEIMTLDDIDINAPAISTAYARYFCGESSGTVENFLTDTANGTAVEVWRVNRTEEATFNLSCDILRLNKTNIGRREIGGWFFNTGVCPRSKASITRDWLYANSLICPPTYSADHKVIITKLSTSQNEMTSTLGANETTRFIMFINGSLGGSYDAEVSFNNSFNKFRNFNSMMNISGAQYGLEMGGGESSPWFDFFSLSCLGTQQYFCRANIQYTMDSACNIFSETDCGLWGCTTPEGEGGTCNFGVIGKFCLNNFTAREVNATGHIVSETVCPPDTTCYEGECLTEEQIEAQNFTLIGTGSRAVGEWLGVDSASALILISFLISIIVGIFGAYKIGGSSGGITFGLIFIGFTVIFGVLAWIPAWIVVVIVILSGIVVAYSMKNMFM